MLNSCQFSASKSLAESKMLQSLVFDEDKVRKGYSEFKADAKKVTDIFQETWLRTEYDTSVRQAVAGEQFKRYKEDSDIFPYWKYLETTSQHPREEHLLLVGNIYKIGDPEGDLIYPPNGFNCVPGNTKILTKDGYVEIEKLNIEQTVIGGSGNERKITRVHKNPFNGKLFNIIKKNSNVLYTQNHRVLTIKGWVRSDEINVGDILLNLRKKGFFNAIIPYINNCYSTGRYKFMSFIIKRQARMVKTFDTNIIFRDKNINPISTNSMIMYGVKSTEIIQNNTLATRGLSISIHMLFRIFCIKLCGYFREFSPNLWSSCSGIDFKFFRNNSQRRRSFFGLSKIRMRDFSNKASHAFACIVFPFICFYPLYLYTLGRITHWYVKLPEDFRENSIIFKIPSFRKFCHRLELQSIEFIKNHGDAAPLNGFDSFYMALYRIYCHNVMGIIEDVKIKNYSDFVYNLTIEEDVSYITETGIVHNCNCSSEQLSDADIDEGGLSVRTTEESKEDLNDVPPQFRFNSAESGILPKESHTYFEALKNANQADGSLYEE